LIDKYFKEELSLSLSIFYSISSILCAIPIVVVVNNQFIHPVINNDSSHPLSFDIGSLSYFAFNLGSVTGIACSVKLIRKQSQSKLMEHALQREKVEAELKFLKAQVSPHFLFNTLNNIYALARKQSSQTPEAVMKLSKLLRFMLYDASQHEILISDELKLIEDYIELEKLRYNDRLKVVFTVDIDNPNQRIAPLILIHFVENAFKHGAGESRFDIKINIAITLKASELTARFINTKGNTPTTKLENKIGMHNTKRQLELLYPKHQLTIVNDDEYNVNLNLTLT
jgi:LytS/YehU family sensor histidine kinase